MSEGGMRQERNRRARMGDLSASAVETEVKKK